MKKDFEWEDFPKISSFSGVLLKNQSSFAQFLSKNKQNPYPTHPFVGAEFFFHHPARRKKKTLSGGWLGTFKLSGDDAATLARWLNQDAIAEIERVVAESVYLYRPFLEARPTAPEIVGSLQDIACQASELHKSLRGLDAYAKSKLGAPIHSCSTSRKLKQGHESDATARPFVTLRRARHTRNIPLHTQSHSGRRRFTWGFSSMANTLLEKLLTPDDVATALGVSLHTLAIWRTTGRYALPFVKSGRLVRYRQADIEAFIQSPHHG